MNELRHELPNDLRLRKFGISEKFLKCLELIASIQSASQMINFDSCSKKIEKNKP